MEATQLLGEMMRRVIAAVCAGTLEATQPVKEYCELSTEDGVQLTLDGVDEDFGQILGSVQDGCPDLE